MMIVPGTANMPPTPWQTEILALGIWAGVLPMELKMGEAIRDERCDDAIPVPGYVSDYRR